jgi:hypothetical protein
MAAAGPLTDSFGARWIFAGAGFVSVLSTVVGVAMIRGVDPAPATEPA